MVGLSLSRSLGFVVVATLANRHGINVRLTDSPAGGITALVTLPPTLLVQEEMTPNAPAEEAADVSDGPMPFPDFAIDVLPEPDARVPGADAAPPFQLEPGLEWAPDPPAFSDPGDDYSDVVPGVLNEPHIGELPPEVPRPVFDERSPLPAIGPDDPAVGGPGVLDPVFGLAPPVPPMPQPDVAPLPSVPQPPDESSAPHTHVAAEPAVPVATDRMDVAFEQGLFALLDPPRANETAPEPTRTTPEPPAPHADAIVEMAFPPAPPVPSTPPPLPQRVRRDPVATAENDERIGSPSRPPEEIRRILSSYRSGLESGRADAEPADDSDEPGGPQQ